jgi:hypothetical protein
VKSGLAATLFLGACAMPPSHAHSEALKAVLAHDGAHWVTASTAHVHLHALAGSAAASRADELVRRAEGDLVDDLAILGVNSLPFIMEVVVLPTREHMRPHTGGTPGGWGMVDDGVALVVADGTSGIPFRHELMHVASWRSWGTPGGLWISEGVATLPTGRCGGYPIDTLARSMLDSGSMVPLAELPHRFTTSETGHYIQAASLVRFVRSRHGIQGVRSLWTHGLRDVPAALGISRDQLEREWLAQLSARPSLPVEWGRIRRLGCEPP